MEQTKNKYKLAWMIVFVLSTAGLLWAIDQNWEWLTLIMPVVCTSFVKGLDII